MELQVGQRIVVHTPDRRSYGGRLLELRTRDSVLQAVVRLDTGWETTYPAHMVHAADDGAATHRAPG